MSNSTTTSTTTGGMTGIAMSAREQLQASAKEFLRHLEDMMSIQTNIDDNNNDTTIRDTKQQLSCDNNINDVGSTAGNNTTAGNVASTIEHAIRTIFQSCTGHGGVVDVYNNHNIAIPVTSYTTETSSSSDDNVSKPKSIAIYSSTSTTSPLSLNNRNLNTKNNTVNRSSSRRKQSRSPEQRQQVEQQQQPMSVLSRRRKSPIAITSSSVSSRAPPPAPPSSVFSSSKQQRHNMSEFGEDIYAQLFYDTTDQQHQHDDDHDKDRYIQSIAKRQTSEQKLRSNVNNNDYNVHKSFFPKSSPNRIQPSSSSSRRPVPIIYPQSHHSPSRRRPTSLLPTTNEEVNVPNILSNQTFDDGISAISQHTLEMLAHHQPQQTCTDYNTVPVLSSSTAIPNVVIPNNNSFNNNNINTIPTTTTETKIMKLSLGSPHQFHNLPPIVEPKLSSPLSHHNNRKMIVTPPTPTSRKTPISGDRGLSPMLSRVHSTQTWNTGRHSTPSKGACSKYSRSTQTTQSNSTKSFEQWHNMESQYWSQTVVVEEQQQQSKVMSSPARSSTTSASNRKKKTMMMMKRNDECSSIDSNHLIKVKVHQQQHDDNDRHGMNDDGFEILNSPMRIMSTSTNNYITKDKYCPVLSSSNHDAYWIVSNNDHGYNNDMNQEQFLNSFDMAEI